MWLHNMQMTVVTHLQVPVYADQSEGTVTNATLS